MIGVETPLLLNQTRKKYPHPINFVALSPDGSMSKGYLANFPAQPLRRQGFDKLSLSGRVQTKRLRVDHIDISSAKH